MTMKDVEKKGLEEYSKYHSSKLDRLDKIALILAGPGILVFIWWKFHISPLDIALLVVAVVWMGFDWITSAFERLGNISLKAIVIIGLVIVIGLLAEINRKLR